MKDYVYVKKDFDVDRFDYLKKELLMDKLFKLCSDVIKKHNVSTSIDFTDDEIKDYSIKLLSIFKDFYKEFPMDFEFSKEDFTDFIELDLSVRNWFLIYRILYNALQIEDFKLIKIFYHNLLEFGPFKHDVESIDFEKDLFAIMTDELKELFFQYDEFFIHKDDFNEEDFIININQLKDSFEDDLVPFFLVYFISDLFVYDLFDYAVCDELSCLLLSLYIVSINKIYKKPVLTSEDISNIDAVKSSLDFSDFDESLIEKTFEGLNKNCWYK